MLFPTATSVAALGYGRDHLSGHLDREGDAKDFRGTVLRTQDWLSEHLPLVAAFSREPVR